MVESIHIIGIGGIGMSALAEVAHARGVRVQGSDTSQNENINRLRELGIQIFDQQEEKNIAGADCVVYSSAIGADNCERLAAQQAGITLWSRADLLAWLMKGRKTITVSGTHGKTTTTALIGAVLVEAGLDPTIINGGIMNAYQSNARIGAGDWMVVEGDESDGTFLQLPTHIAVITNIDREHLSYYGGYENLQAAFKKFARNATQCSVGGELSEVPSKKPLASTFVEGGLVLHFKGKDFQLRSLIGWHNIENALTALLATDAVGVSLEVAAKAFEKFQGVERRWQLLGKKDGAFFYDDYAHHPREIAVTLKAAKEVSEKGKVIALVQPHRYSRLENLFDEFVASLMRADKVWLTPVYEAGEKKSKLDSGDLFEALKQRGCAVSWVADGAALPALIKSEVMKGDRVIAMGAGSIGKWLKEAFNVA